MIWLTHHMYTCCQMELFPSQRSKSVTVVTTDVWLSTSKGQTILRWESQ
uniref:Alternative protein MXRA5 n=1 Tax=Homo sapiens TaxID=9606 RepID=L8ECG1_HUMAN|nr:alternative protein MXRA5 [Homo sapiens]